MPDAEGIFLEVTQILAKIPSENNKLTYNKAVDRVVETQEQVLELKGIMVQNIDLFTQRERLELLIDKMENLVDSSVMLKTMSRNLARAMCMKNLKLTIIAIVVSHIYIIVTVACGG
uniref:Vesicle-associated membrane protein 7 n=1 Tax=Leptobrachium leishanense TaxID=445787 RepID=A0A8C5QM81_9ANUR